MIRRSLNELDKEVGNIHLKADLVVTVGSGGDFATINEALTELSKSYPLYKQGGYTAEIRLLAGFVMKEQVIVKQMDLGYVTITGEDTETSIQRDQLTTVINIDGIDRYPAFCADTNAVLPKIGHLFNMDTSGDGTERSGVIISSNSSGIIISGSGVKNAGQYGLLVSLNSSVEATGSVFSGAGSHGIYVIHSSTVNAFYVNASGSGGHGIFAVSSSIINADSANASGAGSNGIFALSGSRINAYYANASDTGGYGICAGDGSTINADTATATNTGTYSICAYSNSHINAQQSNCSTDGNPAQESQVIDGSTIEMSSASGQTDTNIALNTLTSSGII